jgi:DNA-binding LytR/AlgR family response regulator
MKFISGTNTQDGLTVVLNLDHVLGFQAEPKGTTVYLRDSKQVKIKETIDIVENVLSRINRI